MARRRAAVLIGLHVLILAHVAHWLITGRSMAPVVFSESMRTLENAQLNPGFIAFSAAALVTLVFGRFLCGWACHMGGLQDFCGWLLKKGGLRPRPFRARLLGWVPVGLAFYMFVWPTLRREAVGPALERWWPAALPAIGEYHALPGWSAQLTTTSLFSILPGVMVIIPFLLVCGGATVYFLGTRGLCRYGCPYGGVLAPLEQLAPVRIAVDRDLCTECGRCTAACGLGVRVMEETRAHGRVINRDCVRSLDCVEACPEGALKLRPALPAVFSRRRTPRTRYDLSWGGEAALLGLFLLCFLVVRGLYGIIPMLMAVGIAICICGCAWVAWSLLVRRDVRFARFQLKRAGRLRAPGVVFGASVALGAAVMAQSLAVRAAQLRAGMIENAVVVPREVVMGGRAELIPAAQADAARRALRWYRFASPAGAGGIGLAPTPWADMRAAWLSLVCGERAEAERLLRRALAAGEPSDGMSADLARIVGMRSGREAAAEELRAALREHPAHSECRSLLAGIYVEQGRPDLARALHAEAVLRSPRDAMARARFGAFLLNSGEIGAACEQLAAGSALAPADPRLRHDWAVALFMAGDVDGAVAQLKTAAALDPAGAPGLLGMAAGMLEQAGRAQDAAGVRAGISPGAGGGR